MSAGALALVTGATGFVGRAVCAELLRRGWRVRAALRSAARGAPEGCETAPVGDLSGDPDWRPALEGVGVVIHLAARVHELRGAGERAYHQVNCVATEKLARAAVRAGARRLVFLSSIKVNGERTSAREPFRFDDQPRPEDAYARSKLEAERALAATAKSSGIEVAIVRSPLVYGEGVGANFRRLVRLVDARVPLPFASIRNRRSLIYVGNLAQLIVLCSAHVGAAGRTLLAADGEDLSTPELVARIGRSLGRAPMQFPLPVAVLRLLAAAAGRSAEISRLTESLLVDAGETRRCLDWRPAFSVDEGLRGTVNWYRSLSRSVQEQPGPTQ